MNLHAALPQTLLSDPPTAGQVMTSRLVTVSTTDTLLAAWELMVRGHFRHLPVVGRDGRCLGVVDDRLLTGEWPADQFRLRRRTVADVMPERVHCVVAGESLERIITMIHVENVTSVPVVDARMHLVGLVTDRDIVAWLRRRLSAVSARDLPADLGATPS